MFDEATLYKIELKNNIVYTAHITEEDATFIKIHSVKGEKIVLNKTEISRTMEVSEVD